MPDQAKHAKKKFLLYSLYMRPWTLCSEWACTHVPCLRNLDIVPHEHMTPDICDVLQAASVDLRVGVHEFRNHELSWRCYIRGHVVSQHAKQLIVQFMAACCGRSQDTGEENVEATDKEARAIPESDISLNRIHAIIDGMSK